MATPFTGLQQHLDGGGGLAVLSNSVNKVDSSSALKGGAALKKCSELDSPILIFLFFHKAIRNELDVLHRLAMAFATGDRSDIHPLPERYHFLSSIYRHHSNAEDEVRNFGSTLRFWSFFLVELCNPISLGNRNGMEIEDFF